MLSALIVRRTREIMADLLAGYEQWVAECEVYRRPGLGAPNGYRPHYCEHGTDMWTDYDNICGGCEDGVTFGDPLTRREVALAQAKWQFDARRREYDLPARVWGRMTDGQVKGRYIVSYLETLDLAERDSVKLDKDENHAYWTYIAWLLETVNETAWALPE